MRDAIPGASLAWRTSSPTNHVPLQLGAMAMGPHWGVGVLLLTGSCLPVLTPDSSMDMQVRRRDNVKDPAAATYPTDAGTLAQLQCIPGKPDDWIDAMWSPRCLALGATGALSRSHQPTRPRAQSPPEPRQRKGMPGHPVCIQWRGWPCQVLIDLIIPVTNPVATSVRMNGRRAAQHGANM